MDESALMQQALALAQRALTLSNPNPRVGCVLVAVDGRVIGEGHTQRAGGPHAEVMALRDAQARGEASAGATAFVTLEPCSHHGRTPPCCDALVAAGVARVLIATGDPNPKVAGQGVQRLRAAGVQVDVLAPDDALARAARELNIGFFSRMIRGRPWVRLKIAASLDGITALPDGQSQWITGEAARNDGHLWRARACAVLTGIGTVREDNPRLDARIDGLQRQPHLVVVDSRLETPVQARLFEPTASGLPRNVWIYHAQRSPALEEGLAARGAHLRCLPNAQGKVDLEAMLRDLATREVNELHVEAGHLLNGSLWREGLVDEWLLYSAARLLGQGTGLAALTAPEHLASDPEMRFVEAVPVGDCLRILVRRRDAEDHLPHSH
jgi:diaminohydroxyphosphoribosylaminopyrimidine deaminase/5-amino-6-(5-phosphoribosylamino)uracil reductase